MILFLDLETTGLDPFKHHILEVAAILTDDQLREMGIYTSIVRFEPEVHAADISPVVVRMHTVNGLWSLCVDSQTSVSTVDIGLENWLRKFNHDSVNLAGHSIHFDQSFLRIHMPHVFARLSRHLIDVEAFDQIAERLWPDIYAARPKKSDTHRAQDDVQGSYRTMRYYALNLGVTPKAG